MAVGGEAVSARRGPIWAQTSRPLASTRIYEEAASAAHNAYLLLVEIRNGYRVLARSNDLVDLRHPLHLDEASSSEGSRGVKSTAERAYVYCIWSGGAVGTVACACACGV